MEMMVQQTRGKLFAQRRAYVEDTLGEALKPVKGFGGIRYAKTYQTEEEYVVLTDDIGVPCYINVTGLEPGEVWHEVVRVIMHGELEDQNYSFRIIHDRDKQRRIRKLLEDYDV